MIYRISFDVEAGSAREAFERIGPVAGNYGSRVEVNPLTEQEETIVLELARTSLSDGETYDYIAEELDLSDDCLKELQEKIEKKMLTPV